MTTCTAGPPTTRSSSLTASVSASPGQSVTPWTRALQQASTPAEFQTVTEAVLGDGHSGLDELIAFLDAAARWCDRHQEKDLADHYRHGAMRLAGVGRQLADSNAAYLARTHQQTRRTPLGRAGHGGVPPAPPPASRPRAR
ncbi:hypothetical protein ACIBAG_27505 [Streptomyces sp. NPDC051243]|uniref:hypothetical protein n=1 Tax=Streptomyces sp. NPDC051243 TaxID=3365646 RepID=UPI0037989E89